MSKADISPELHGRFVEADILVWNDRGSGGKCDGAFYRPGVPADYCVLGYYGQSNYDSSRGKLLVIKPILENLLTTILPPVIAPLDYRCIWADKGSGAKMDGAFWEPVPPIGYKALGVIVTRGYEKPDLNNVVCVREDLVERGETGSMVWADIGTGANDDMSSWTIEAGSTALSAGTFCTHTRHCRPTQEVYVLKREAVLEQ